MAPTLTHRTGADSGAAGAAFIKVAAAESTEALAAGMKEDGRLITMAQARIVVRQAEFGRRQAYSEDGATSLESWTAESLGASVATARSYSHVAEKSQDLPHLMGAMSAGEISFDKVRTVVDVATPETDRALCAQAKELSVRELAEVARTTAARARSASSSPSRSEHDSRYLRFNPQNRTMTVQLPTEDYARTVACVDAFAAGVSSEEKTPLDQRRCDGFTAIVDSVTPGRGATSGTTTSGTSTSGTPTTPNPFFVVAHVPLQDLVDDAGLKSELAAELEHHGLIDVETVQRIACDATVVVAVDDSLGHTMYEGRAWRFPSGAQRREVIRRDRHCRFPGCSNATFAAVHHIVPWKLGGGTDLDNLVLLCKHHHGVVHRNGWSMTGNPNEELRIENPKGRVTASRPSVLWTRVTGRARAAVSG
ncbi:MAG TPA: DUF222 domain-containing protein [Acidimicrobiales bacterium]